MPLSDAERKHQWYLAHRDRSVTQANNWKKNNPEKRKESAAKSARKSYAANPEKYRQRKQNWRKTPQGRAYHVFEVGLRRAVKSRATPPWITATQAQEIKSLYELAALCEAHVDHIIPLKNPYVCGLHVPWNLQLLTPLENIQKGNRFA